MSDNLENSRAGEPRAAKVAAIAEVREKMQKSSAVLVAEYRGLRTAPLANLRRSLMPQGGEFKVYKNTLARRAADELGIESAALFTGPTAIAFVDGDAAAVAKTLRDFAKTNPLLIIKGGVLGSKVLSAKDVEALADLPSRDVLLAQIAGAFQAPMVKFAGLLQALPHNFAYGLKALIDQKGGAPEAAPAELSTSESSEDAAMTASDEA